MCWSLEVSIIMGTISYVISAYLWTRNIENDRWHAILLGTVSTIQFLEAAIWRMNQNGEDKTQVTKIVIMLLIPLVLASEPVASMFGASYVGNQISTFDKVFYSGAFITILTLLMTNNSYPNVVVNGTIHYQKGGINNSYSYWIFFFLLIYPFIKYGKPNNFYILTAVIVGTALAIALGKKSPGSTWCLYGNIIAVLFLFYPMIAGIDKCK